MIERPLLRIERRRCEGKRPRMILALALLGLGFAGLPAFIHPAPWLVWNASASAPIGLYRVVSGYPERGDLVLVRPPKSVRQLAAERGYLPSKIPLIKRVAAFSGDEVCAIGNRITINGRIAARRLIRDRLGRALPSWSGCQCLDSGEVFLLIEEVPDSFDSRYFGPVPAAAIIGKLVPLWTG